MHFVGSPLVMQGLTKMAPEVTPGRVLINMRPYPPAALPPKVLIVEPCVFVQHAQVAGEFPGRREVVHMDEGVWGRHPLIVLLRGPHHHWDYVIL